MFAYIGNYWTKCKRNLKSFKLAPLIGQNDNKREQAPGSNTPECTELDCTGGVYKAYFSDKDRKRTKLGRRTTLGFKKLLT